MLTNKASPAVAILYSVMPILSLFLSSIPAKAQSNAGNYTFLIGSGYLCENESASCPAAVKSANGDSYEMSGAGTLEVNNKSVTAAGTFTHRSPDGNALETGVWVASELVTFDPYGIAPGARTLAGPAFDPPPFGPRRMHMLTGSVPAGGMAVMSIRLLPMWGPMKTAVLQVYRALGKVPEDRQTEGIRLAFDGGGGEFDEEVSGRTMFVLTGQAASPERKSRATGDDPTRPPAQVQQ